MSGYREKNAGNRYLRSIIRGTGPSSIGNVGHFGTKRVVSVAFHSDAADYNLQLDAGGLSLSTGKAGPLLGRSFVGLSRGLRLKMLAFHCERLGNRELPHCGYLRSLGRGWRSGSSGDEPSARIWSVSYGIRDFCLGYRMILHGVRGKWDGVLTSEVLVDSGRRKEGKEAGRSTYISVAGSSRTRVTARHAAAYNSEGRSEASEEQISR